MHTLCNTLLVTCLSFYGASALGYEGLPLSVEEQQCYGKAMVGLDSVINARLGVPAEHALALSKVMNVDANNTVYSKNMLKTVLDAYFWEDSPHSYAIKVFYGCAKMDAVHSTYLSASEDWIYIE